MRKIFPLLSIVLVPLFFALLFSFFFTQSVNAQAEQAATLTDSTFTLDPPLNDIDDFLTTVDVTFNDEAITSAGGNMFVCLESDLCIDDKGIRDGINDGKQEDIDKAMRGMEKDDVDEKTIERYKLINGKITVCGDGESKLKPTKQYRTSYNPEKKDPKDCVENRDFFHAGKIYLLSVYEKTDGPVYILRSVAGFYVNHGVPEVTVLPNQNLVPGGKFEITVSQKKLRAGGNKRNNYQIVLEGEGIINEGYDKSKNIFKRGNGEECIALSQNKLTEKVSLPLEDGKLTNGTYTIKINEQINEDSDVDKCQGGFTYYRTVCKVILESKKGKTDIKPNNECKPYPLTPEVSDPNKSDLKSSAVLFAKLGDKGPGHRLPCKQGKTVDDPLACDAIDTAIGSIPLDPIGFITKIFSLVLSFAGLAAVLIIFYWGYRLLISRGDKEVVQKSREHITSAIVGLLFIIFSLVLLSVIAGDVLKIPGFN